jgi:hypothetical protein
MAPLRRADGAAEAWAWGALAPLCAPWARAVYPLPEGGATHCLLVPTVLEGGAHARALRVTPPPVPMALVQRAALRLSFLQLDDVDGAPVGWRGRVQHAVVHSAAR